jgi:putative transposase
LIRSVVLPADIQDRDGARDVCYVAAPVCPRLEQIWADHAYAGALVEWMRMEYGWRLVIVAKPPEHQGFVVHLRRWVVERTIAWVNRNRRLSKDYEELPDTSEAWLYLASTRLMLRRLVA